MKRGEPIAVFGYAFAHRKTQDFLIELALAGYVNVTVIATAWKELPHTDSNRYFSATLRSAPALPTPTICQALGFAYHECEHDDSDSIAVLRDEAGFQFGVISGARIIKREIIDLFQEGILNIHPGKLPETAGLDSFFYTILRGVAMGVTAHYIDSRVDAGDELFFEETPLGPDDTIEVVQSNNYQLQIRALREFIVARDTGALARRPVNRHRKNDPMTPEEKRCAIAAFPSWRATQFRLQQGRALLDACRKGDAIEVERLLTAFPDLVEFRSPEGWTPIIISAHGQKKEVVRVLIAFGCDVNACGKKGTTVLMYAKTPLVGQDAPDLSILRALLDAGADPARHDALGKDIFYYLGAKGDRVIGDWLAKQQVSL
jgi:hypothetical protein